MSTSTFTNRNRWIAQLVILLVIALLLLYFVITFALREKGGPQIGHRSPIASLTYCGAEQEKLCIVSFSQLVDGGMQVNFQTPYAFYPAFLLKISNREAESTYTCERVESTSTSVVCTGAPQVPGQVLRFTVISKKSGTIVAVGEFAIIGIALFTPAVEGTGTIEVTLVTPTNLPTVTPAFNTATPTQTLPGTSYPNPSYP